MQSAYIPVLIYAALVVAFPAVTLVLAKFIRPASTSFGAMLHRGDAVCYFRRGDDVPHSLGDSVQGVGRCAPRAICSGFDGFIPRNSARGLSVAVQEGRS